MSFMRYATALTVEPTIQQQSWNSRVASTTGASPDISGKAAEILGGPFNPHDYVLSHCSIVCSVDTLPAESGIRLGSVQEDGRYINRKYGDFRINPSHDKYINNNLDAFERKVVMKAYRTFVGAQNYQEHVQRVELSKGRILDAVARNLGDSTYIDILVATHKKHAKLVKDIKSGKMNAMSMGASVASTICTKCGNVAKDETELCHHVRYEKGNVFHDAHGNRHRVAELCGHVDMEPTGGVHFIEASWVADPAFKGAVMRNRLELAGSDLEQHAERVLSQVPQQWQSGQSLYHAASIHHQAFGGGFEDGDEEEESAPEPKEEKKPLDKVVDDLYEEAVGRIRKRVKEDLDGPKPDKPEVSNSSNDNVVRQARANFKKAAYQVGLSFVIKEASSEVDLVNNLARYNAEHGFQISTELYRAALRAGAVSKHGSQRLWAEEVRNHLNRTPSPVEAKTLVRLASVLDQWTQLRCS